MLLTTYKNAAGSDRAAASRLINGMRDLGWHPVRIADGESSYKLGLCPTTTAIVKDLMATDEATLILKKGELIGSMFFVFGNEPYEVLANCSYFDEWNADLKLVEAAANLDGENA